MKQTATKTKTKTTTAKETTMQVDVRGEIFVQYVRTIEDVKEIERRITECLSGINKDFPQIALLLQQEPPANRITEEVIQPAATPKAKPKTTRTEKSKGGGKMSADGKRYFSPEALTAIAEANRTRYAVCTHPQCGGKKRLRKTHNHFRHSGGKYMKIE